MVSKSFEIALPSFLTDEKNQLYVLAFLFVCIIIVPAIIIFNTSEKEDDGIEVHAETYDMLPRTLIQ